MRARLLPVLFLTVLVAPAGAAVPEVTISGPSPGAYINAADPNPYPVTAAVTAGEATGVEFFRCDDATPGCLGGTWVSFGVVPAPGPYTASMPLDARRESRAEGGRDRPQRARRQAWLSTS
jgi:hypothetical protein